MKIHLNKFMVIALGGIMLTAACKNNSGTPLNPPTTGNHEVVVQQVIPTSQYSYMEVKEGDAIYWIAAPLTDVKKDQTVYFSNALEMKNFKGEELDKVFDVIYFVDGVSNQAVNSNEALDNPIMEKPQIEKSETKIEPAKGGISVATLFEKKTEFAGKKVRIKGKVVKYNPEIMGMNWVHLQDGSSFGESYDITFTTTEQVTIGDVIVLEGTVALDKDFGAGYKYDVIVEQSAIIKE